MSTGTVYPLGTDTPDGWAAEEIIYYKLSFNMDSGFQFVFLEDSGIQDGGDIGSFIASVLANTVSGLTPLSYQESAPDLRITKPCYIVIALDPDLNWRYLAEEPGILLGEDLSDRYFGLEEIDTDGDSTEGEGPASDKVAKILYFGVLDAESSTLDQLDPYNLYVEFDMGFGSTVPMTIDPDIKNDGGPPSAPGLSRAKPKARPKAKAGVHHAAAAKTKRRS